VINSENYGNNLDAECLRARVWEYFDLRGKKKGKDSIKSHNEQLPNL